MAQKFQKRKLKNGITISHEYREIPVVSFSISNPLGGSFENSEIKGISHFIEHMLFTGTKNLTSEQISKEIESKGGVLNAYTAQDVTSFWFKLPSEHLFSGINIITEILSDSNFNEEKFEKERKVILEEIKMRRDNPQTDIAIRLENSLYGEPFGTGILGTKETISALKRDFVFEFFKKSYSPENYIVTLVGKADFEKVCDYLEKKFKPSNKKYFPLKIAKINKETIIEKQGIDQANFAIGMHAPDANSKQRYVLEVLDSYLAGGMSSRLFLEIREKRGLAYMVASSINTEKNYSYYGIYIGTTKESIPEVKSLIIQEFKNIEKMTEKSLEESKEKLIGLREVSSEEGLNVMNELIFSQIATGNSENHYKYKENINSVTLKEVKSLAPQLIKKYSTTAIVPK